MVLTGVHEVKFDFYHTGVVMFVSENSSYWSDDRFNNTKWGSVRYATIGGEALPTPYLEEKVNRKPDRNLDEKVEMQWLHSGSGMIRKLFAAQENYANNTTGVFSKMSKLPYAFMPTELFGTYNSNSYARGILESVGLNPAQPSHSVPGWDRPAPVKYFK